MAFITNTFRIIGVAKQAIIPDHYIPAGAKSFGLSNYGQTMSPVVVEYSNDQTTWATAEGTSFGSIGSGGQAYSYFVDGRPWWRVQGAVGTAGATSTGTWTINY